MLSQMVFSLVLAALAIATGSAGLVAWIEKRTTRRTDRASDLWRSIRLRNGVTEPLPWHPATATVNIPGMVEVKPNSVQNSQAPHDWDLASQASVSEARPLLASMTESPDSTMVRPGSELVNESTEPKFEITDPPSDEEKARVQRLFRQGLSQYLIIRKVWGLSKGGGKKYKEARSRYFDYVYPIAQRGLRFHIDQQRGKGNA